MGEIFKGDNDNKKVRILGNYGNWGNMNYPHFEMPIKKESVMKKIKENKIKKKMGRPLGPETEKITFALHKPLINDVRRYCKEHDIVMQRFVEKAIEQYMLLKINDEI